MTSQQLGKQQLSQHVAQLLEEHALPARLLGIEIAERRHRPRPTQCSPTSKPCQFSKPTGPEEVAELFGMDLRPARTSGPDSLPARTAHARHPA